MGANPFGSPLVNGIPRCKVGVGLLHPRRNTIVRLRQLRENRLDVVADFLAYYEAD